MWEQRSGRTTRPAVRSVAALLVGATVMSVAAASDAAGGRTIADGAWSGSMTFVATIPLDGSFGAGSGTFAVEAAGGTVEGPAAWDFIGVSGSGDPTAASVTGRVAGAADAPQLFAEVITTTGTSIDNTGAPGLPLEITRATCELVEGTGEGRPPVDVEARWQLVRAGSVDDPEAFAAEASVITTDLVDLSRAVAAGEAVDRWTLFSIVDRALLLTSSLRRSGECDAFGAEHRTIGADIIARLLELAISGDVVFDTEWFVDLVMAAIEVGAIGAGAGDAGAAELEFAVVDALLGRIDAAAAAGDSTTLFEIGALAQQAGWRSVEDAAIAALGGSS